MQGAYTELKFDLYTKLHTDLHTKRLVYQDVTTLLKLGTYTQNCTQIYTQTLTQMCVRLHTELICKSLIIKRV